MKWSILLVLAVLLASSVTAIGVSPPRIILENVPKGYVVENSVILSGVETGSVVTTSLSGEGADWVTVKLGNRFTATSDRDVEFPFVISIPEEIPNGIYEVAAQIIVSPAQEAREPNSAMISSGVMVNIQFTVTGREVKKYRITNVQIPSVEAGLPIAVVMNIKNEGNVLAKPEGVELVIKDRQKDYVASAPAQRITSVQPYKTDESVATFDLKLDPGFYFADVKIDTENRLEEKKDLPFDILKRGSFSADGKLMTFKVQGTVEEIAKIDASFRNTGEADFDAVLKVEVYTKGLLIDVLESEALYVKAGDTKEFVEYYPITNSGEYTLVGYVEFLDKKTNTKEVTFTVSEQGTGLSAGYYMLASIVAVNLLIVIVRRRRKRR